MSEVENNFGIGDGVSDSLDFEEGAILDTPGATVTSVLQQSDTGVGCRENNAACFCKESKAAGGGLDHLVGMTAFDVPDLDPFVLSPKMKSPCVPMLLPSLAS